MKVKLKKKKEDEVVTSRFGLFLESARPAVLLACLHPKWLGIDFSAQDRPIQQPIGPIDCARGAAHAWPSGRPLPDRYPLRREQRPPVRCAIALLHKRLYNPVLPCSITGLPLFAFTYSDTHSSAGWFDE